MSSKNLLITGIRGIPAAHGGFETFAENLALYLVQRGWSVTVYCQEPKTSHNDTFESDWNGIHRVHIPVHGDDAKASVIFDYYSIKDAIHREGVILTLGYNTALLNGLLRLKGRSNIINMDGIEWQRGKWAWHEKAWLYLNERAACLIGHHLIADHPEIKNHLKRRSHSKKISMIPYGARQVSQADEQHLDLYGLKAGDYAVLIARPEPENSILEIVKAFAAKPRRHKLVILGNYHTNSAYQQQVLQASTADIIFTGAIYNHEIVDALRYFSCLYIHGHTVGGTNPSLVEALGAGQPVLAHDNIFNRWVAGEEAAYFKNQLECEAQLEEILSSERKQTTMSKASRERFNKKFTWRAILAQYEALLLKWT